MTRPDMIPCPNCGQPMPAKRTQNRPRKFCSTACSNRALTKRHELADEVEHLASFGLPIPSIVKALDTTPGALARALMRAQRHDLANAFERYDRSIRRQERAA